MLKHKRYILYLVIIVVTSLILYFLSFLIPTKVEPSPFSFSQTQKDLAKNRLFLLEPAGQKEIFAGRWLNKYEFAKDATKQNLILILWLDDSNDLAGILALYEGNRWGTPAEPNDDKYNEYSQNETILRNIERLTKINLRDIIGEYEFKKQDSKERLRIDKNDWKFLITRAGPLDTEPSIFYRQNCHWNQEYYEPNALTCDIGIYSFMVSVINW